MKLKCPACENDMTNLQVQDVTVDLCKNGCGGIWFDNYELEKFDEEHEHVDDDLLNISFDKKVKIDFSKKRECPRCNSIKLRKRFFSVRREIEIDECGMCGGIFLDRGELEEIRRLFKTEKDRKEAAKKMFNNMFSDTLGQIDERKKSAEEAEAEKNSKRRFGNLFGLLSGRKL
ncbi:MAG: zf-TFIIB domain-containing protein [Candidatus Muiribacteriota bacterium]